MEELHQQQQFQGMLLQPKQHFQQQQEGMNMAMLNTFAEIVNNSNWTLQPIHDDWGFETTVSYINKFNELGVWTGP